MDIGCSLTAATFLALCKYVIIIMTVREEIIRSSPDRVIWYSDLFWMHHVYMMKWKPNATLWTRNFDFPKITRLLSEFLNLIYVMVGLLDTLCGKISFTSFIAIFMTLYNAVNHIYPSFAKLAHISVMILIIVISSAVLFSNQSWYLTFNMGNK